MRITEVSTLKLRFSMATPMADAIHYMPERNLLLVQITTDDSLVGLGECAAYGGSLDSMERVVLDDLQPSLIGEDPFTSSGSGAGWRGARINAVRRAC